MNKNIADQKAGKRPGAKTGSGPLSREKPEAKLKPGRDIAASVSLLEEHFLATPGMSLAEISRAVLKEARRLTGSRLGFAGYIDPATKRLIATTRTGKDRKTLRVKGGPFLSAEFNRLWGRVLKTKKPLLTNSAPAGRPAAAGHVKVGSFLGAPAVSGRKLLGILAVANPRGAYSAPGLETIKRLARVYALLLPRKLAEDRQRRERGDLLAIISSSQDIIYSADLDGKIVYASPRVAAYGYRPKDLLGRSIFELVHPDDRKFTVQALANARKTGRTLPMISFRLRKKDGEYFSMEQKSGIVMSRGKPALVTGVVRDVSEETGAEDALKESEATLLSIFESTKDAIFIKDLLGRYVKVNKACAAAFNMKAEAVPGKTDADIFPPEAAREAEKDDQEVVRTGRTLTRTSELALPSGKHYFSTVKTTLRNAAGGITGVLGVARDITNLREKESALAVTGAADALGKVARPVAHDLNNALAVINGYATLIDEDLAAANPAKAGIGHIISAAKWAAELTTQLQAIAREPKPVVLSGGHG